MRSVICATFAPAARAYTRKLEAPGTPAARHAYCTATRGTSLRLGRVDRLLFVRIDDARHQRVAHDVHRAELGERDSAHLCENAARLDEAALLAARKVDLRDVSGYHGFRAEADPRQEHLHLLRRRVLRLVEDDERVVEGAPAHVGKRRELDRAALEELAGLVETHEI